MMRRARCAPSPDRRRGRWRLCEPVDRAVARHGCRRYSSSAFWSRG